MMFARANGDAANVAVEDGSNLLHTQKNHSDFNRLNSGSGACTHDPLSDTFGGMSSIFEKKNLVTHLFVVFIALFATFTSPAFTNNAWAQEDEGDEDEEAEEGQPLLTAGGLFTKENYPLNTLKRPMLVIGGMTEVRAGFQIGMSEGAEFDAWHVVTDVRYGMQDNVELQASFVNCITECAAPLMSLSLGFEVGLIFEQLNFKTALQLSGLAEDDPKHTKDIVIGFPYRHMLKENVAINFLEEFLTFHTAGGNPDLTIGIAGIHQVNEQFSLVGFARIVFPAFDFDTKQIPLEIAAQYAVNRQVDIGGAFSLTDVNALKKNDEDEDVSAAFDARSIVLYAQFRI